MLSAVFTFVSIASLSLSANAAHSGRTSGGHSRRAVSATQHPGYSALVAFGASYTDNAHPRDPAYNDTFRFEYGDHGRYCNGPVAVEYMVTKGVSPALPHLDGARPELFDYAFGGAQIDNSLTNGTKPDGKIQVASYLKNITDGTINVGKGKVLHYVNTGINPVTQIWAVANATKGTKADLDKAKAAITANAKAVISQMRSIHTNAAVAKKVKSADFIIVGIPPLEIVPNLIYQAGNNTKSLALAKQLCAQYNAELKSLTNEFKKEVKHGKVIFFDLAALWYRFHLTPAYFGLTQGDKTCYNSSTGVSCSDSSDYLYWDTLHPVTSIQRIIATRINGAVKKAQ